LTLEALLTLISGVLVELRIPYMLTGSLAAAYHGAPRATQDIDLVVDASVDSLLAAAKALRDAGLYVSDDAIREAASAAGMFNAIDPTSGWKVDFIVKKRRPFSVDEFNRRRDIEFMGLTLSIAQAEDVILAKLEWAKLADSERQLRDIAEMLGVQGSAVDRARIERWANDLKVAEQWQKAQDLGRAVRESV
jgi:hypothetical protein